MRPHRANGGHHAFRVTTVGDTGVQHEGEPGNASASISTYAGTGTFWFWPPVPPQATQLRMTVGTLPEAARAPTDIPGRQTPPTAKWLRSGGKPGIRKCRRHRHSN